MRARSGLAALAVVVLVGVGTVVDGGGTPAQAAPIADRISGPNRYETSAAVSRAAFPRGGVDTVVIANGTDYADGLSAGPAAAAMGGPLLLSGKDAIPGVIRAEIARLSPERIVIAGGTAAISPAVEAVLRPLAPEVVRAQGSSRYGTSMALIRLAYPDGAPTVYVATGRNFPDALAGGGLAAVEGAPMLIVAGNRDAVAPDALTLLDELGTTKTTIIGGPVAVTDAIQAELAGSGRTVERITGANRYQVSLSIAERFPRGGNGALLASGLVFADAISATSLAATRRVPILLTGVHCAPSTVRAYVSGHNPARLTTIGGHSAIRGLVGQLTPCQSTTDPRSAWVVANKRNAIRPAGYAPSDLRNVSNGGLPLRNEAAGAMERMAAAMQAAGYGRISVGSAFRSYSNQAAIYNNYVRTRGQAWADGYSAKPGHSEHQTGWAADVVACGGSGCGSIYDFEGTPQQRWIAANAHKWGFIVRYEKGYTHISGYNPEPWHLRYVGVALATDYTAGGFHTLEQYLGYGAAPNYR